MKLPRHLLFFLLTSFSHICQAQCPDTLHPAHTPCCISGIDWSEEEKTLFLVSDLENKVYKAKIDLATQTIRVFDSLSLISAPHAKGLEAMRKKGSTFYLTFEKDEWEAGSRKARAFVSKGKLTKEGEIQIEKSIEFGDLPNNKGIEGLTLSPDGKSIWVAHETMARPKDGLDSTKFIQLDTNLKVISSHAYPLWPNDYFKGNTAAYDDYGVTEVLYLKDSFYVLERGWGKKEGKGELFLSLFKVPYSSFHKSSSLYTFSSQDSPKQCIDNFEGVCFIPSLGKLLIVSDDNNQKIIQKTIFRLLSP